jgi:hypothetical protein
MKSQFYSVYGRPINEDVFSSQRSTTTSSSLVVTKEKYDNLVKALQLHATTKKKDQFMKNAYLRHSLESNLKDNCLFRKVVVKPKDGSKESQGVKPEKVIWYEKFFDVIHETHISMSHSIYFRTHKLITDKGNSRECNESIHKFVPKMPFNRKNNSFRSVKSSKDYNFKHNWGTGLNRFH